MEQIIHNINGSICYEHEGKGQVVVLLHGFGEDKSIWNHQINFLKNYYQLIIPNLPGTGKSSLLQGLNIQIEDYADWLFHFLQHFINPSQKIILLGHSMGGYIGLAYAKKYAETLAGFGLIHSTAFTDSDEKKEIRKRAIDTINEYGAASFLKNTIPNLFASSFKENNPTIINELIAQGKTLSKESLIQYYKAMMNRPDSSEVLKQSSVAVLFIMGKEDVAAPLQDVLQQCHLPKISDILILDNVAHMGMLEATEQINEKLLSYLQMVLSN
ncbi:MAG: alpha/beta hydrolase [Chitinophagaceae bacterium]|nr:alpha/beta hydrolase [Chitinophagaceae bacterium]